jgi:hypothetical protein
MPATTADCHICMNKKYRIHQVGNQGSMMQRVGTRMNQWESVREKETLVSKVEKGAFLNASSRNTQTMKSSHCQRDTWIYNLTFLRLGSDKQIKMTAKSSPGLEAASICAHAPPLFCFSARHLQLMRHLITLFHDSCRWRSGVDVGSAACVSGKR